MDLIIQSGEPQLGAHQRQQQGAFHRLGHNVVGTRLEGPLPLDVIVAGEE